MPQNPLTEQDNLAQMKKRKGESWADFLDRYAMYAQTCTSVASKTQVVELYKKLPKEMRSLLIHLKPEATLNDMLEALQGVRYYQHCINEPTMLHNPMEIDVFEGRGKWGG